VPGDGRIDFPSFFGAVEASGFTGPLALEIFSSIEYPDSLWRADPFEVVVRGRTAIEEFWEKRTRPEL
jgi:sugar phosphate isomerase/epimerase